MNQLKQCRNCQESFPIKPDDLEYYQRLQVAPPTLCPNCRMQNRHAWRNEFNYYQRPCDLCNKQIISTLSPDKPYTVYCHNCWWSDKWDPLEYGIDYDPNRSFFEQFKELHLQVPQLALVNDNGVGSENCEYCNDFAFGRNCYLVTGSWQIENSLYSTNCNHSREILDCVAVNLNCELVYESLNSEHLYNCSFLQYSYNCANSHFGFDLIGCNDCFSCYGLRQKRYHIFNKPHSKEEYEQKLREFNMGSYTALENLKIEFRKFRLQQPHKASFIRSSENCSGNNLHNCNKLENCFEVFNGTHCKFFESGDNPKHCYDIIQSGNPQWCYYCITPDDSYNVCFSLWCWKSSNVFYSDNCHSSKNLFGCVSLKREEFSILNQKYSPTDYEQLRSQIIQDMSTNQEWSEFFPISLSPFGYNETIAQDNFPLNKESATKLGYHWREQAKPKRDITPYKIPDHIKNNTAEICNEILTCQTCQHPYQIQSQEFKILKKMQLPIPNNCPTCRRQDRFQKRPPFKLFERNCSKCSAKVQTVYSANRPEIVYCEGCYQEIVA